MATLDGIEDGALVAQPQPADGVSLAPKITVDDARVDWAAPALGIDRLVRGCTPAPGAWTTFRGERLKLGRRFGLPDGRRAAGAGRAGRRAPGRVCVGTGSQPVRLGEVQPPGKKPMPAADWARGVRVEPGERLG